MKRLALTRYRRYQDYIASPKWRAKREQRLQIDGYRCRALGCTTDLEVHHVTYDSLYMERMEDLITFCRECHAAITAVQQRRIKRPSQPVLMRTRRPEDWET